MKKPIANDLTFLLGKLTDEREPLSERLLFGLSDLDRTGLLAFQAAWADVSPERRRDLLRELTRLAEDHIEVTFDAIYRWCLSDPDPVVRTLAIEGLWESEDTALVNPLVRLLEDDEVAGVRAAAASSLGRFVLLGELEEIEAVIALRAESALWAAIHTAEEEVDVRRRAVESVAYSGEKAVRDVIRDAYYDEDERMRMSAVFAMGRSADRYWRDLVLGELENPHPGIRFEAARAAGELELEEATPYLIALVDDVDPEVQQAAILALGNVGGREAKRVLMACADSDNEAIRAAAEDALEVLEFNQETADIALLWDDEDDADLDWSDDDDDDEDDADDEG